MKTKFYSLFVKILSLFLILLGFSTCSKPDPEPNPVAEYGCPYATFKVIGIIVDKDSKKPIEGIQAVMHYVFLYDYITYDPYSGDTVYTDRSGKFSLERGDFPEDKSFLLKFNDIDGELNGMYESKDMIIEFINPNFSEGDGKWNGGETSKDIGKIELETK